MLWTHRDITARPISTESTDLSFASKICVTTFDVRAGGAAFANRVGGGGCFMIEIS
ncbi:hypothetical protein PSPO01_07513 [Paraphaeosphaeria sporulosa]